MSRYIDADALDNRIKAEWAKQEDDKGYGLAHFFVETQPTADVAPICHAHWVQETEIRGHCSNCGAKRCTNGADRTGRARILTAIYKYCSECGAKMDEDVKENE